MMLLYVFCIMLSVIAVLLIFSFSSFCVVMERGREGETEGERERLVAERQIRGKDACRKCVATAHALTHANTQNTLRLLLHGVRNRAITLTSALFHSLFCAVYSPILTLTPTAVLPLSICLSCLAAWGCTFLLAVVVCE